MATGTEVGATYGDEGYTGLANVGHGILSVVGGVIVGRLTYPGPQSNGISSQDGDCSAILAVAPWLAGGVFVPPTESHDPRATFDGGLATSEGWVAPGTTWKANTGGVTLAPMSTDVWAWINADGTFGTPPGGVDAKVAARADLKTSLLKATAAAEFLSA